MVVGRLLSKVIHDDWFRDIYFLLLSFILSSVPFCSCLLLLNRWWDKQPVCASLAQQYINSWTDSFCTEGSWPQIRLNANWMYLNEWINQLINNWIDQSIYLYIYLTLDQLTTAIRPMAFQCFWMNNFGNNLDFIIHML